MEADEVLARSLQRQFDEEEATARYLEENDWKLAVTIAGSHDISDSDTEELQSCPRPVAAVPNQNISPDCDWNTEHTEELQTEATRSPHLIAGSDSDSDKTVDLDFTNIEQCTSDSKELVFADIANAINLSKRRESLHSHPPCLSDSDQTVDLGEENLNSDELFDSESEPEESLIVEKRNSDSAQQRSDHTQTVTSQVLHHQHKALPLSAHWSDSGDSDRTIDPNEEGSLTGHSPTPQRRSDNWLSFELVEGMAAGSSNTSLPYEFKKTNSSLHSISDSDSADEDILQMQRLKHGSLGKSGKLSYKHDKHAKYQQQSPGKKSSTPYDKNPNQATEKKNLTKRVTNLNVYSKTSPPTQSKHPLSMKQASHQSSPKLSHESPRTDHSLKKSPSIKKVNSSNESSSYSSSAHKVATVKRSRQDSESSGDTEDCTDDEADSKPICQYGQKCYRKNPSHLQEFQHPGRKDTLKSRSTSPPAKKRKSSSPGSSNPIPGTSRDDKTQSSSHGQSTSNPYNLYLTKVAHIPTKYNDDLAMGIKDILSPKMGNLQASAQFNYMTDIAWLMEQYPASFRNKPLLIVHGMQRENKTNLDVAASNHSNIKLCQARLEMAYGTHHTKMMFLLYDAGMRVVIHTANLIENDWFQRTQGIWISPLFPKMSSSDSKGDSVTNFKQDLLAYLAAYKSPHLREWQQHIQQHDMTEAVVYIIGSVPGRHAGNNMNSWGHLKLRKVLKSNGPTAADVKKWPVVGQFSSIGTLGASADKWVSAEWLSSLSAMKTSTPAGPAVRPKLQLVYPTRDNVRLSLEGYVAGGSLPYSIHVARRQPWFTSYLHQWKSDKQGRSRASPHIKTYLRSSPDSKQLAWFLVTSANLSKAAWGALEKNNSQLMVRSYELGVLLLPQNYGQETFKVMQSLDRRRDCDFVVPYDLPLTPYTSTERPWIWDIPYKDKPDSNGNMWCPS